MVGFRILSADIGLNITKSMKYIYVTAVTLAFVYSAFGQVVGGYSKIAVTDPAAVAAAKFAVDAKEAEKKIDIELDSIATAEQQVVAGMNYRLCLNLTMPPRDYGDEGKRSFKVVVYKNLQSKLSLTSWDEVDDCGTAAAKPAPSPSPSSFNDKLLKLSNDYDYFAKTDPGKIDPNPPKISKEEEDRIFSDFINSIPDDPAVVQAKADNAAGNFDKALAAMNKYIAANPNVTAGYEQRAVAYHGLKRNREASADAAKALSIDPKSAQSHITIGTIALDAGDLDGAVAAFTRAVNADPKSETGYYDRGTVYAKQAKWQLAVNDLTKAIEIDPRDALAYLNRAISYGNLGNFDAKIEDLQVSNELDPSSGASQILIDNIRALTPKQFEEFANKRLDRLNDINRRIHPEEDIFGTLYNAKDVSGICRQLRVLLPLRVARNHELSRAIILELRTDLESFKPIIESLKQTETNIAADEKILATTAQNLKCQ